MVQTVTRRSVEINFEIEKGSTFRHVFTWKYTTAPNNPIDLTGCTARMQIRETIADIIVKQELTTENGGITLGGASGTIDLYISDTDSTAWDFTAGVYGLEVIFPNGDVRRLARGKIKAFDEATR